MNLLNYLALTLVTFVLVSCEERTGYYTNEQQEIIAKLTANEWRLVYEHIPNFEPDELQEEGWVYKFNANGTGSFKWMKWEDGSINDEPTYFHWTFTTDNFNVIYIDKTERFFLIDKLTAKELWVYNSYQDPVLYPNADEVFWKFVTQ